MGLSLLALSIFLFQFSFSPRGKFFWFFLGGRFGRGGGSARSPPPPPSSSWISTSLPPPPLCARAGAIEDYWRPDADTVVVVADSTFPNFLQFNSGDRVEALTRRPFRRFWIKLQSDYGTLRFVRRAGEDQALLLALRAMRDGLSSPDAADAA